MTSKPIIKTKYLDEHPPVGYGEPLKPAGLAVQIWLPQPTGQESTVKVKTSKKGGSRGH